MDQDPTVFILPPVLLCVCVFSVITTDRAVWTRPLICTGVITVRAPLILALYTVTFSTFRLRLCGLCSWDF